MYNKAIYILCLVLIGLVYSQGAMEISISHGGLDYFINDPIQIEIKLTNRSGSTLNINTAIFHEIEDYIQVANPQGEALLSYTIGTCKQGELIILKELLPNQSITKQINLLQMYPDVAMKKTSTTTLNEIGMYSISCSYSNEVGESGGYPLWTGSIQSEIVEIQIKPFSNEKIDEIVSNLESNEDELILSSITCIRKAKLFELMPEVENLALNSSSIDIQREAGKTLFQMIDVKYFNTYLDLLDSDDAETRGYASLSLGQIGDNRAVPRLIEKCNPLQYPRSYTSAMRALINIGDKRAIPVLESISASATDDYMKQFVEKEIVQLRDK